MTTDRPDWATDLDALADRLRALADGPPHAAMLALGDMLDAAQSGNVQADLRAARRKATAAAVTAAGGKAALSRLTGRSRPAIDRALDDSPREWATGYQPPPPRPRRKAAA